MPKRTKKNTTKTCRNCEHLLRDEKFADEIRWKCNNYKDKDGKEASFDRLGDKEAGEDCDDCVNWTKKIATSKTSPPPSVGAGANTQDTEERKREELLEAYKKRDEIQHDLYRAKSETTQLRSSIALMSEESKVAESLLHDLASIDGAGESWSVETVSNFLIAVLGQNTRKSEDVKRKLSGHGGKARELHAKLSKLNNEIRLLFERGPNPQQKFDMEEEE